MVSMPGTSRPRFKTRAVKPRGGSSAESRKMIPRKTGGLPTRRYDKKASRI